MGYVLHSTLWREYIHLNNNAKLITGYRIVGTQTYVWTKRVHKDLDNTISDNLSWSQQYETKLMEF